jgi:hypothetical protein
MWFACWYSETQITAAAPGDPTRGGLSPPRP